MAFICGSALACSTDAVGVFEVGNVDYEGRVHSIETLGRYSATESRALFSLASDPELYSVETEYYLYRIVYPTQDIDRTPTLVSALLAVPTTRDIKGIVSWHHGTNTYRPNSISKPSIPEGLGVSALFGSDRYILVAADYIGLGTSTRRHPYYHWPSMVNTVVDLLHIAELVLDAVGVAPDHDLYLVGFSQGGRRHCSRTTLPRAAQPHGATAPGRRIDCRCVQLGARESSPCHRERSAVLRRRFTCGILVYV